MAVATPERARDELARVAHRSAGVREFTLGAARVLSRSIGFEGVCVVTMDPATLLPTREVVENGLPREAIERMREIEIAGGDVNSFVSLARGERRAASMSGTTAGDLARSERHREVRAPHGMGDELRAALGGETATWGALTLMRSADTEHFEDADVELVASLAGSLGEGLRHAMLLTALQEPGDDEAAGLLLLGADNAIVAADATAERWLAELDDGAVPAVVGAVATRARGIAGGRADADGPASARVRTPAGRWLLVRGSALDGRTAVIIEAAGPRELAPLVVDAYGLTERERAVTRLVAEGLPTDAIGRRLHISPWTVQDHLKAVFEKVGVGTRGELVARLYIAPRLA